MYAPNPSVNAETFGDPTPLNRTFETNRGGGGPEIALPYVTVPLIKGVPDAVGVAVAVAVGVAVFVGVPVGVFVGVDDPLTVMLAVIEGCTPQKYGNVPAPVNVKLKVCPLDKKPEFQTLVLLVAVCVAKSLFVHLTVSPTFMVRFAGLNAKPDMLTSTVTGPLCGGRTTGSWRGCSSGGSGEPQKKSV